MCSKCVARLAGARHKHLSMMHHLNKGSTHLTCGLAALMRASVASTVVRLEFGPPVVGLRNSTRHKISYNYVAINHLVLKFIEAANTSKSRACHHGEPIARMCFRVCLRVQLRSPLNPAQSMQCPACQRMEPTLLRTCSLR